MLKKLQHITLVLFSAIFFFVGIKGSFGANLSVTSSVDQDFYSTIDADPLFLEYGYFSSITARLLFSTGDPISNVEAHFTVVGTGGGITTSDVILQQPVSPSSASGIVTGAVSSTRPGIVTIGGYYIIDGVTVEIKDTVLITFLGVPNLILESEPSVTRGLSNEVAWTNLGHGYKYQLEVSTDKDFNNVVYRINDISESSYEVVNLENSKTYWYRVRAVNSIGNFGAWSNVESSTQDNEPPRIEDLEQGDVNDEEFSRVVLNVTDNIAVQSVEVVCSKDDSPDVFQNCGQVTKENDKFIVHIDYDNLRSENFTRLCIYAIDSVGNASNECRDIDRTNADIVNDFGATSEDSSDEISGYKQFINKIMSNIRELLSPNLLINLAVFLHVLIAIVFVFLFMLFLRNIYVILYKSFLDLITFLGWRKQGNPYGVVYNSVTKEPVSGAIIRIYNDSGKLVYSDVSNSYGVFDASLQEGRLYKVSVSHPDYIFPSKLITSSADGDYKNIYLSGFIKSDKQESLEISIPVDPKSMALTQNFILRIGVGIRKVFASISLLLTLLGLILAVWLSFFAKNGFSYVLLVSYVLLFTYDVITRVFHKVKNTYGKVSLDGSVPLEGLEIGLIDLEYNKRVARRVTDKKGQYRFLVEPGRYKIELISDQYVIKNVQDTVFDYSDRKNGNYVLAVDLNVSKKPSTDSGN